MKFTNAKWLLPAIIVATPIWLGVKHYAHANDAPAAQPAVPFVVDHGIVRVPEGSPLRGRLVIAPVTVSSTPHQVIVPGQVDADPSRTVNVLPPLTGRVTLKVGLGDTVKKGQLLAQIASGDMAQAYSDFDKARDALDLAKKTLDRTRSVQQTGAAAMKDIEAAESGVTQAEAEYVRAKTRLESFSGIPGAGPNAESLAITSPIDGVVTALNVGQGSNVDDPTAAMMTVTDISTVWVTANIAEDQIGEIQAGDDADVRLTAYPGEVLHGKVVISTSVVSPDTRRLPVHIVFRNPDGRLMPNMYADVAVDVPQHQQVMVPQSALLMHNDSTTVLVEVSPWAFERRTVELGYDEGDLTRVLSGLKPGDRVVVKGGVLTND